MQTHKYAEFFPLMAELELASLAKSINESGLLQPIVLVDGKILDGRNRYKACRMAGIEPRFQHYSGQDALKYVVSINKERRHLTVSQLSVIALELEKEFAKRAQANIRAAQFGGS